MTTSTKFGIPYIASQQATPEITHNAALYMLELLGRGVKDRLNVPPGAPVDGDTYLITAVATGAWAGKENHLTIWASNTWYFLPGFSTAGALIAIGAAHEGMQIYVQDEDTLYRWTGAAWAAAAGSVTTAAVLFTNTDRLLGRDTAAGGAGEELTVAGGLEFTGTGIQTSARTGDVTKAAGGTVNTIANSAVTSAKFRDSVALSVVGRSGNTTGVVADIVAANDGEVLRRSGTVIGFGTLAAGAFAANTAALSALANAAARYDIIGRKTAAGGAWEDCTPFQLKLPQLDAGNIYTVQNLFSGAITLFQGNSDQRAAGFRYGAGTGETFIGSTNSATPDMIFENVSAVEIGRVTNSGDIKAIRALFTGLFTVATLPAAGIGAAARAFVSDHTGAFLFGAAPTGGGSVNCPVFSTGGTWLQG